MNKRHLTALWSDRYKERERVNESAAAQEAKRQSLGEESPSEQPASAADTFEWHDDKDDRADRFVTTVEGDLDTFGRPMRQGS